MRGAPRGTANFVIGLRRRWVILMEGAHWEIVRLSRAPEFRAESQSLAERIGMTVDEVNVAFTRLLRLRLLETDSNGKWIAAAEMPVTAEREFLRLALTRVRQKAAESNLKLPRALRLP